MASGIELDYRSFGRALDAYLKITEKDLVTELNRRMRWVIKTAIMLTAKGDKAKIREYFRTDKRLYKIFNANHAKNPPGSMSRKDRGIMARRMVYRAVASVGYLRSGYFPGLEYFGGTSYKQYYKRQPHTKGWGKRATVYRLVAEVANMSFGIDEVGPDALQAAINQVTDDMIVYIMRKLGENWAR